MKKLIKLFVLFLSIATISSCALLDSNSTIEFTALPKPTYTLGTSNQMVMDAVKVKINGTDEYTLTQLNGMVPGASFSGLDFTTLGSKVLTVTYDTVTISFTYQVITVLQAQTPDTSWYTNNSSATEFHLKDAGDLRGLADLVNHETNPIHFEGKTVYLDADIDLAYVTWTPIGEGARKENGISLEKIASKKIGFLGKFDGQNHIINGLSNNGYTSPSTNYYQPSYSVPEDYYSYINGACYGLFGVICDTETAVNKVVIKNIKFSNLDIGGQTSFKEVTNDTDQFDMEGTNQVEHEKEYHYVGVDSVGAVVGGAFGHVGIAISNCHVLGGEISGVDATSGILGRFYGINNKTDYLYLKDCSNNAKVSLVRKSTSAKYAGILAILVGAKISAENCSNAGEIVEPSGNIKTNKFAEIFGWMQMGTLSLSWHKCTGREGKKLIVYDTGNYPEQQNDPLLQDSNMN